MKCPKCGSENFRCSMEKGRIANKRLPMWVGVLLIISYFLFLPLMTIENLAPIAIAFITITMMICLFGGITYLAIRANRLYKEKQVTIIQYKCQDCGYEQLEKVK